MPKRNAEASAERIIKAAANLLETEGWPGFGVNSIAQRANLGKPLLYRYFDGRAGVELELRGRVSNVLELALADRGEGGSAEMKRLIAFGRALAGNRLARDWLAGALAGHIAEEELARDVELPRERRSEATMHALLLAGIAFILIWRDRNDFWAGVPISSAKDMAQFEYAIAALVDDPHKNA